jgi:(p)ppGpp synthase/HD superfamily hydrolase
MLENLEDVILFASLAHKDQLMMDPEVPYLTHLISVAGNVLEAYHNGEEKFDLDVALKLAILHDTIEDTNVTYDDIKEKFGEKIADGVLALSKNESLPYGDRLEDSIARIKGSYKEVAIVKLADRLNNLMIRPKNWNDDKWNNYLMLSKYLVNNLASSNKYLAFKLDEKILNYRNNTVGR